jgi:hypothetical protein
MRKPIQLNLFGQPVTDICEFCGFPFTNGRPRAYRCEYELARGLPDFSPFKVFWHVDLEEEERAVQEWLPVAREIISEALENDPKFLAHVERARVRAWVESKVVKAGRKATQASLIPYLIPRDEVDGESHG